MTDVTRWAFLVPAVVACIACGQEPSKAREERAAPAAQALVDVTDSSGLDFVHRHGGTGNKYLPETMGAGGCALDYDGDGLVDLYLVQSGFLSAAEEPGAAVVNRLYRNRGDGTFNDVTDTSGTGHSGYGMGAVAADYDNDGDTDIYVVNFGPNALLRNNGDATFTEVGVGAGVADPLWGSSASFFDADGDGDLDLYVANYLDFTIARSVQCGNPTAGRFSYCHPDAYPMAADVFYRNRGDGTFEDATFGAGLTDGGGKGLGVVVADIDNDLDPDVYVANDSTPNFLYRNRGDGSFEEVGLFLGVGYNEEGFTEAGMGTDIGDVNGDGYLDIVVTNLSRETNALYLGGPSGFTYSTRGSGLHAASFSNVGFGTDLLDLDNDGDLDLFVANGHVIDDIDQVDDSMTWRQSSQVFLNDGGGVYSEFEPQGMPDLSTPRVGRASLTLDYDNDGRLDLLVTFNNDRARLFRNTFSKTGNWIGFHLQPGGGNRLTVGTQVTVETPDRNMVDELKAGSSYQTSSDPRLVFGLGERRLADRVTVRWPGGQTDTIERLQAGRYYVLRQNSAPVAVR